MRASQHNPFALRHPAVAFTYLVSAAAFAMAAAHPVYATLALAGSAACACCTRGWRAVASGVPVLVGVIAVVALANALFVPEGATPLLYVGERPVTLEALGYGLCSGTMLAAVFLWFSSYAACMDSAATASVLGRVAPTIALMVSQVMRLVPQFVARGRTILATERATSAAAPRTARERAAGNLRTVSVLMGWGLEDSLTRSDAMRARGWGCGVRRTSYVQDRLGRADIALLAIVAVLVAVNIPLAAVACSQFSFYPTPPQLLAWWGYVPYAALMLVAPTLYLGEVVRWRS